MEVGVRVETERLTTGAVEHVGSAYVTMVALDAEGKPSPVPPLRLDTCEDKRRYQEALERKANQLARVGRTTEVPCE